MPMQRAISGLVLTDLYTSFLLTALVIELTPGPNMAWLALTSASQGRRSGFAAVAGIALGLAILAAASAIGLAELATRWPAAFNLLRYAGVAYLLWLAWKAWTGENEVSPDAVPDNKLGAWFRHGLLLNLLNPKAALFFIAVLPAYIDQGSHVAPQVTLLSASYVGIATLVHLIIVALAAQAHAWISVGNRSHLVRRMFAILLAGIGVWFLISTG
ncbi:LysE family translocator [Sphingorhabdus sp.]|uniref:LysE family translocator n=1 Tax=Sphingorhabdus sp. TaxID=1902408 RepID=UPI003983AFBF